MEKFNAIKMLEEEQKDNELFYRNLGKEHHQKQLTKFVNKYIKWLRNWLYKMMT